MKIALIYTSTTPELIQIVEKEVREQITQPFEIISMQDPDILSKVRDAGYVTAQPAAKLIKMYMEAVLAGADAILNICSSVGEVADASQDVAKYIGVPIVRIDEEMCRDAVRKGKKIAIMATLSTTLEPTKNTVKRVAREMGTHVEVIDALVDGAFGLDQEQFKEKMLSVATVVANKADVILFAQGSMAYCEEYIASKCDTVVLSSPRYGAKALKKALEEKYGEGIKY